jgi:hypothetical protein
MPFDEEDNDVELVPNKRGLRQVSSQKSIFDGAPQKQTQQEFDRKVKDLQERASGYKQKAAEYSAQFKKSMLDKTLQQNKSIFAKELESELLSNMIKLAVEVNNDPNEQEGMGSLMWIILLLKTCLMQRDKINFLEYSIFQLEKKLESIADVEVKKEINNDLDKRRNSG